MREKSFLFAIRIVKLSRYLRIQKKEFVIAEQILKCGTSIGANIAESVHAQSRPDFTSKLNISLKEAAETDFWLCLLHETNIINQKEFDSIIADCRELESLLASIVKTLKA